jgi:hypothetical protein
MSMFGNRTAGAAPAAPSRSRYAGVSCADTRDPMLSPGTYRVRIVGCETGYNRAKGTESYKIKVVVLQAAAGSQSTVGSSAVAVFTCTPAGIGETKRAIMHAAGFGLSLAGRELPSAREALLAAEAEYDKLDEQCGGQGSIIEASAGVANGAPSVAGRLVDVVVSRGNPCVDKKTGQPTGDYYRCYAWGVVPDAEQVAP